MECRLFKHMSAETSLSSITNGQIQFIEFSSWHFQLLWKVLSEIPKALQNQGRTQQNFSSLDF
jgi:hypothetical protein